MVMHAFHLESLDSIRILAGSLFEVVCQQTFDSIKDGDLIHIRNAADVYPHLFNNTNEYTLTSNYANSKIKSMAYPYQMSTDSDSMMTLVEEEQAALALTQLSFNKKCDFYEKDSSETSDDASIFMDQEPLSSVVLQE
jgi:hypothetical protein